jgi:hypothetical protein
MFDDAFPPEMQNYWKSGFVRDLSDDALKTIAEHAVDVPSPTSLVMLENYHGAYSRVGQSETAYSHRDAHYDLLILASWTEKEETDSNVKWARSFFESMQPYFGDEVFPNLMGQEEIAERAKEAYGVNYARLAEIKKKYDPTNFFRLNLNINPAV